MQAGDHADGLHRVQRVQWIAGSRRDRDSQVLFGCLEGAGWTGQP